MTWFLPGVVFIFLKGSLFRTYKMNQESKDQSQGSQEKDTEVAIIGGGKVGCQLLTLFLQTQLARVAFVVDRDGKAPAIEMARSHGVATFGDIGEALHSQPVDFIFEVTGSDKVLEMVREQMDGTAQLFSHAMTFILMKVIEENRAITTASVKNDILAVKQSINDSLLTMESTLSGIKQTTSDMRYLSLNARIEAARVGENGRGFDIVAQQVENSAQTVRDMTQQIDKVRSDIATVADQIEVSLKNLQ
jgi:threonine dehydrogenase-like Zn-dependent dehydrogenase